MLYMCKLHKQINSVIWLFTNKIFSALSLSIALLNSMTWPDLFERHFAKSFEFTFTTLKLLLTYSSASSTRDGEGGCCCCSDSEVFASENSGKGPFSVGGWVGCSSSCGSAVVFWGSWSSSAWVRNFILILVKMKPEPVH